MRGEGFDMFLELVRIVRSLLRLTTPNCTSDLVVEIIDTMDIRPSRIDVVWTASCGVNETPVTFG